MNTPCTIIEYEDDLIFAACEFRWSKGDKFALIEAIAICAANDLQYPNWVRSQINVAMTGIFEAVFPDQDLTDGRPGLGIAHRPEGRELADTKDRYKEAVKTAVRKLCLCRRLVRAVMVHVGTDRRSGRTADQDRAIIRASDRWINGSL